MYTFVSLLIAVPGSIVIGWQLNNFNRFRRHLRRQEAKKAKEKRDEIVAAKVEWFRIQQELNRKQVEA